MTNPAVPSGREAVTSLVLEQVRLALGDPSVAAEDDFFAVGGDSILAVRVIEELRKSTGVAMPIALFYTNPTADELGEAFAELLGSTDEHATAG
jgi:aryl carrier-like protein